MHCSAFAKSERQTQYLPQIRQKSDGLRDFKAPAGMTRAALIYGLLWLAGWAGVAAIVMLAGWR
jgi:hypothetical protein